MAEQLALLSQDRVYESEIAAWETTEAYYSRPEYAWPLLTYLRPMWLVQGVRVVEPCVGGGHLVQGLQRYGDVLDQDVLTGDVRNVGADWCGDWTQDPESWVWARDVRHHLPEVGLVVTNPPFTRAADIVEASWARCPHATVAILQRVSWYEPTEERGPWLRAHNPDKIVIGRCEFFRPDGTSAGKGDSTSYAWFVWDRHRKGPRGGHSEIIPWKEAPNATIRKGA